MLITETQTVKQFSDESEFESTLSFSLEKSDVEDWVVVENDAQELSLSLANWKKLVEMGNKVISKQETIEQIPNKSESILAKISHQNDLGSSQWYEVVYYDNKWCSFSGSKTFEDGEKVIEWKYCKELF
jgi:hypothetical protein